MDREIYCGLRENRIRFKRSLDMIVDKYSKVGYLDGVMEVDLANIKQHELVRYLTQTERELSTLESKSLADLREESLAQDITGNSQHDFTLQDGGADETGASRSQYSEKDDGGMGQDNSTEMTVSSLDESEQSVSETELQPEDQDEELEMTLRRQGSSFVKLYPSMIRRMEEAKRQTVSKAADSVQRYHRRQHQSREDSLNNTLRHSNPGKIPSAMQLERRQLMSIQSAPHSSLRLSTSKLVWRADQPCPGRERAPVRTGQDPSVCTMDLSRHVKSSQPKEISLKQKYTMSDQLGEQPRFFAVSPSRSCYPTAKSSGVQSLRSKRHSLSAHAEQAPGCSTYAPEASLAGRSDSYSSPVRQSPLKSHMINSLSRSSYTFSRSPRVNSVESFSQEPMGRRSVSPSFSSPPQKPIVPQRMPYPQDFRPAVRPQLHSPQAATAGRPTLRRHLSVDSSLQVSGVSYTKEEIDEEILRLYHKYVCLNKSSFFNSQPCRLCRVLARSPEASRASSSSALASLALSPHRSILRKRNRELDRGGCSLSKCSREEGFTSSPGSKRHGNEMLRRRLDRPELSREDLFYSSSRHSMCKKFSMQQPPADKHQEAGRRQGRAIPVALFSGHCGSRESSRANGSSPRKWQTRITPAMRKSAQTGSSTSQE